MSWWLFSSFIFQLSENWWIKLLEIPWKSFDGLEKFWWSEWEVAIPIQPFFFKKFPKPSINRSRSWRGGWMGAVVVPIIHYFKFLRTFTNFHWFQHRRQKLLQPPNFSPNFYFPIFWNLTILPEIFESFQKNPQNPPPISAGPGGVGERRRW